MDRIDAFGAIDELIRNQRPTTWEVLEEVAEAAEARLVVEPYGVGFRLVTAGSGAGVIPGVQRTDEQ
jgi:hypothetical protein